MEAEPLCTASLRLAGPEAGGQRFRGGAGSGNAGDDHGRLHQHSKLHHPRQAAQLEGLHDQSGGQEQQAEDNHRVGGRHGLWPLADLLLALGLCCRLLSGDAHSELPVGLERAERTIAEAGQRAVVALGKAMVHLVVARVCRVWHGQVKLRVEGQVVRDVENCPGNEAAPCSSRVQAHRLGCHVHACNEDAEAVHLLEGVLVCCIRVASEGHKLPVVLLVTVRVELSLVGYQVKRVVDDVIDAHDRHEGHWAVQHTKGA
mmetsp:Transcript_25457/g.52769  ORF Transcript_25457/g.52769 Transcript_25457/m.52769 type:complete len:259 (+) Transcript_25457:224-1000(+)